MKRKITQLAKGIIDVKIPEIRLQTETVTAAVSCGQQGRGELSLISSNGVPFRGLIYADDDRIEIPDNAFAGLSVQIPFLIHAEELRENEELNGSFALVTNAGDLQVPYQIKVSRAILKEHELPEDAAALGQLAAQDPDAVMKLFQSDVFLQMPLLEDEVLRALYTSLRRSADQKLALEEFLTACGAKEPVGLYLNETPRSYLFQDGIPGEIALTKSGEGYCLINAVSECGFIRIPKEHWNNPDFTGDVCRIPLYFLRQAMHAGKNCGAVRISTGRRSVSIPVTVMVGEEVTEEQKQRDLYRRSSLQLYRTLLQIYGDPSRARALGETAFHYLDACDEIRPPEPRDRILRAELCRLYNRREEEKALLDEIRAEVQRARNEDPVAYLWFLYLEEEREHGEHQADGFLRLLYRMKEANIRSAAIFPLLRRVDPEWAEQPERSLERMREYYLKGELTLLLAADAIRLYNDDPSLMKKMGPFEQYLLRLGARNRFWTAEMAQRGAELMAGEEAADAHSARTLEMLYADFPENGILQALLTVLIRSGQPEGRFHHWYALGIEQDIRLSELYEFYLSTIPEGSNEEIPQMVLLYYTYNSPKWISSRLNLYHYILTHSTQESRLYRLYEKQMQNFALEQLLDGAKNDRIGEFYEAMFIPEVVDARTAPLLTEFLYTQELHFDNTAIQEVKVVYGELEEEFSYPVTDGEAYVPIYSDSARAVYVDAYGNRYARTALKRRRFLNGNAALLSTCRQLSPDSLPFKLESLRIERAEDVEGAMAFLGAKGISETYREKLMLSLIREAEKDPSGGYEKRKAIKDSPYLSERVGHELAESCIRLEDDETAIELIHRFGCRGYSRELLLELLKRQIRRTDYAFEESRYQLSLSLYRAGAYNPVTLTYLCRYFNGGTKEMRDLLSLAGARDSEALVHDLPARLLAQMLFTGETEGLEEVFAAYLKEPGYMDRFVTEAYLVVQSERSFKDGIRLPEETYTLIRAWAEREKKVDYLPVICRIALTKRLSEKRLLSAADTELAEQMLSSLYNQGLLFAYMKKLGRFIHLPAELADNTLIEYRGDASVSTEIGFRILPQEKDRPMSFTEMPHVFGGIYVKPVLLFADEKLEYEIRTVAEGQTVTVDQGRITLDTGAEPRETRFTHLNRILEESTDTASADWQDELLAFGKQDVLLKDYFNVQ